MSDNATAAQISSALGLQAIPENVRQLTRLISRQDGPLDEITLLICKDKELTRRLLRAANPRASSEDDYVIDSVEAALVRAGIGCALLLAMSDPLIRAVKRTFETMIGVVLTDVAPGSLGPITSEHVVAEVGFSGKATGGVTLRLSAATARAIATTVLGFAPDDIADVNDVVGELGNMVVGNFKSNLCDAGLPCKLDPPKIGWTSEFKLASRSGGLAERVGFRATGIDLFVDILVNPWND